MTHDGYLKLYQLSEPDLGPDAVRECCGMYAHGMGMKHCIMHPCISESLREPFVRSNINNVARLGLFRSAGSVVAASGSFSGGQWQLLAVAAVLAGSGSCSAWQWQLSCLAVASGLAGSGSCSGWQWQLSCPGWQWQLSCLAVAAK